jgi:hypothetical protein
VTTIEPGHRLRSGSQVGRTLYLHDTDNPKGVLVGVVDSADLAAVVCEAVNAHLEQQERQAAYDLERASLTDAQLHAQSDHPEWEYETTQGQRKAWDYSNEPPEGDGWERNVDAGHPGEGWERFDYHEESYWRRLRRTPPAQEGP